MEGDESNNSLLEDGGIAKRAKLEAAETDRLLNFATAADEFELSLKRHKDPVSHRIIEKRRRDRMNNCLADLSRLIPSSYHKQGQGRIEKTEIIDMAIKHINLLQERVDDAKKGAKDEKPVTTPPPPTEQHCCATKFYLGFKEAQDEVMRFLVEVESVSAMDPLCKKIMKHLENASKKFIKDFVPRCNLTGDVDKSKIQNKEVDNNSQAYLHQSAFYPTIPRAAVSQEERNGIESEDKNRDKHLRSLLAEQQNVALSSHGSGSISEAASAGTVPLFSFSDQLTRMGSTPDPSGICSSGYVSDLSNLEKRYPSDSMSSRDNVYKFKHNITKRFSQEGRHLQHHHSRQRYDTSSSSNSSRDLEDDQNQLKWKNAKHSTRHGSSNNTYFKSKETSINGNNSANSDDPSSASVSCEYRRRRSGKSTSQNACSSHSSEGSSVLSVTLPGFILHPSGTHYMPISVHNTNVSGLFDNNLDHDGSPVFHPISIPVQFRSPVISMPNVTICSHVSSQRRERGTKQ